MTLASTTTQRSFCCHADLHVIETWRQDWRTKRSQEWRDQYLAGSSAKYLPAGKPLVSFLGRVGISKLVQQYKGQSNMKCEES